MRSGQLPRLVRASKHAGALLVTTALTLLVLERDARAYLEPGSMNFILQSIVGAILGMAIYVKLQWKRLKGTARRIFRSKRADDEG